MPFQHQFWLTWLFYPVCNTVLSFIWLYYILLKKKKRCCPGYWAAVYRAELGGCPHPGSRSQPSSPSSSSCSTTESTPSCRSGRAVPTSTQWKASTECCKISRLILVLLENSSTTELPTLYEKKVGRIFCFAGSTCMLVCGCLLLIERNW